MRCIPYGYYIKNGQAVPDEKGAAQVREAFALYLLGETLDGISKKTEIGLLHTGMARLLENKKYLGTDHYPKIIEGDMFALVQAERKRRKEARNMPKMETIHLEIPTHFTMRPVQKKIEDPFLMARYLYTLIEDKE